MKCTVTQRSENTCIDNGLSAIIFSSEYLMTWRTCSGLPGRVSEMLEPGKPLRSLILLIVLLMTAGACSRTQVVYTQLDWIIPRYIDHYISLNDEQYDVLDVHTQQFLQWHCSTHLHKYAEWFTRLSNDVDKGHMETAKIELYVDDLQVFWEELVDEYIPGLAAVLYQANDEQVTELFKNITDKNAELFAELVEPPLEVVEQELAERMQDRFVNWFGSLTPAQLELIKLWSKKVAPHQRIRLVMRERWKNNLHRLFVYRQELPQFVTGVRQLIKNPQQVWTREYKQQFAQTREGVISLIEQSVNSLTAKQRQYFIKQARSRGRDLNALSCNRKMRVSG
jgi:hypothetical protein